MSRDMQRIFASLQGDVSTMPDTTTTGSNTCTGYTVQVHNSLRRPIFWRNALGIVVTEPAEQALSAEEVVRFTIIMEFDQQVKIDARLLLNELVPDQSNSERKALYKKLQELENTPAWNTRTFRYSLCIGIEELTEVGGVAYLNDLDIVVGFLEYRETVEHPYTRAGQCDRLSDMLPEQAGVTQRYMLVDNAGIHGRRYINTGFEVFELEPIQTNELEDGVFVTVNGLNKETHTRHYSLEDADKSLGLYKTHAEARAFGDPESRYKAELKERADQLAMEKIEQQEQKQRQDREHEEYKRRVKTEDEERKRLWHYEDEERKRAQERETHRLNQETSERKREQQEEDDRRRRRLQDEDDRRQREKAEHERDLERDREELRRNREKLSYDREALENERKEQARQAQFERDQRQYDRKDRSEAFKAGIEIGKSVLSIVSVGMSLWAVTRKSGK